MSDERGVRGRGRGRGEGGRPNQSRDRQSSPPRSEWIFAGISAALVVGAIAFLLHDAATASSLPADVNVRVDSVVRGPSDFVVAFTARNVGGATAAGVRVTGELRDSTDHMAGQVPVERSSATLRYVPASSRRRGGLLFTHDPRAYRLSIRAEGYTEP